MTTKRIALIPGDGIGMEVMPEGLRVLEAAGSLHGVQYQWQEFDWSCEYSAIGGIQYQGTDAELVVQQSIFTRRGVDRVLREGRCLTRDMGGTASTEELGKAIAEALD